MWAELDADRWSWADRARSALRRDLAGFLGSDEVSGVAHVMLVGDSQAGKTTLLLHLLGVTDPATQEAVRTVLAAGRAHGNSATATPIRYGWSPDPERWLLVSGDERDGRLLDDAAMSERLARYRSTDGENLRWQVGDPPLQVGLPTRLAADQPRRDLRILDLPGLYARGEQEQLRARELIAAAAPGMSLIVIVEPAPQIADATRDEAIRTNPHLSGWAEPGTSRRFRFVATQAFSTMPKPLEQRMATLGWEPGTVVAVLRRHLAEQALDTMRTHADPADLTGIMYPVDLGASRTGVDASPAAAANRLALDELAGSIVDSAGEDGLYLAEPALADHAVSLAKRNAERRAERVAAVRKAADAVAGELEAMRERRRNLEREAEAAERDRAKVAEDVEALRTTGPRQTRGEKPPMRGPEVRAAQTGDHEALAEAAARLWEDWRRKRGAQSTAFPATLPVSLNAEIVKEYDRRLDCCGKCTHSGVVQFFTERHGPDHCYDRMTNAFVATLTWTSKRVLEHAIPTLRNAESRARAAQRKAKLAELQVHTLEKRLEDARHVLKKEKKRAAREQAEERKNVRRAQTVLAVHSNANREYVAGLARRAETADPDERGFLAVAALRAVYDLDRMYARR